MQRSRELRTVLVYKGSQRVNAGRWLASLHLGGFGNDLVPICGFFSVVRKGIEGFSAGTILADYERAKEGVGRGKVQYGGAMHDFAAERLGEPRYRASRGRTKQSGK